MTWTSRLASIAMALFVFASSPVLSQSETLSTGHADGACETCHVTERPAWFRIVSEETHVEFRIDNFGFSEISGRFTDVRGAIQLNRQAPDRSTVGVRIRTNSVETGNELLDQVLASGLFFDAESYPEIVFSSTDVAIVDGQSGAVTGDISIRGVTRPVTLNVTFNRAGTHPVTGLDVAGFSARGTINRRDFGMTLGPREIADEVELGIEVVAVRAR